MAGKYLLSFYPVGVPGSWSLTFLSSGIKSRPQLKTLISKYSCYSRQRSVAMPYVVRSTIGYHSNNWAYCIFFPAAAVSVVEYFRLPCCPAAIGCEDRLRNEIYCSIQSNVGVLIQCTSILSLFVHYWANKMYSRVMVMYACVKKVRLVCSYYWNQSHRTRDVTWHYGITQCYLPSYTSKQ